MFSNETSGTSSARSSVFVGILSGHIGASEDVLTFIVRKAAHIFIYFVLGILVYNVVKDYKFSRSCTILLSIVFVLGYASFDEFHQLFISGRSGEPRDVAIDTVAGSLGVLIYYFTHKTIHIRKKRQNDVI